MLHAANKCMTYKLIKFYWSALIIDNVAIRAYEDILWEDIEIPGGNPAGHRYEWVTSSFKHRLSNWLSTSDSMVNGFYCW
jgi:hypothetical protein